MGVCGEGAAGPRAGSMGPQESGGGAGELKVRNSAVGERAAGMRVPLRWESRRGSMDLRRRWPPRGRVVVSIA